MRWWTCGAGILLWALLACSSEEPQAPKPKPPAKKPVDKSSWKEIETPVPVGKKLACAALLPPDKVEKALGKKLAVVDDSERASDATAVCRLVATDKKGKLGDELCMVSVYCWSQWNVADMRKKCEVGGEQISTDIGAFTCLRTVPAGDKERHVVTSLEPDTRCKIVVNAGPSVFDVEATRSCARTVVDLIDKESIKQ